MKLKCCGCKAEADVGKENNVGKMEEKSGFNILFLSDGGIDQICPTCFEKASEHLVGLAKILGPKAKEHSLYSLLLRVEKENI